MPTLQVLLSIGVPVLVILFGILLNQRAVDRLEARMDIRFNGVDGRFDKVEGRFNSVEGRFNGVEGRFNGIDGRLDRMQSDLSQFYRDLGEHSTKIDLLMDERNKRQA